MHRFVIYSLYLSWQQVQRSSMKMYLLKEEKSFTLKSDWKVAKVDKSSCRCNDFQPLIRVEQEWGSINMHYLRHLHCTSNRNVIGHSSARSKSYDLLSVDSRQADTHHLVSHVSLSVLHHLLTPSLIQQCYN